ncbi:MAG: hypothetical protein ACK57B_14215 [Betaproteobacteria bacterium]|jgi:hypothetical protein
MNFFPAFRPSRRALSSELITLFGATVLFLFHGDTFAQEHRPFSQNNKAVNTMRGAVWTLVPKATGDKLDGAHARSFTKGLIEVSATGPKENTLLKVVADESSKEASILSTRITGVVPSNPNNPFLMCVQKNGQFKLLAFIDQRTGETTVSQPEELPDGRLPCNGIANTYFRRLEADTAPENKAR